MRSVLGADDEEWRSLNPAPSVSGDAAGWQKGAGREPCPFIIDTHPELEYVARAQEGFPPARATPASRQNLKRKKVYL